MFERMLVVLFVLAIAGSAHAGTLMTTPRFDFRASPGKPELNQQVRGCRSGSRHDFDQAAVANIGHCGEIRLYSKKGKYGGVAQGDAWNGFINLMMVNGWNDAGGTRGVTRRDTEPISNCGQEIVEYETRTHYFFNPATEQTAHFVVRMKINRGPPCSLLNDLYSEAIAQVVLVTPRSDNGGLYVSIDASKIDRLP